MYFISICIVGHSECFLLLALGLLIRGPLKRAHTLVQYLLQYPHKTRPSFSEQLYGSWKQISLSAGAFRWKMQSESINQYLKAINSCKLHGVNKTKKKTELRGLSP
jgi:hypothetical protein